MGVALGARVCHRAPLASASKSYKVAPMPDLTFEQLTTLRLLADDKTPHEIAAITERSPDAVESDIVRLLTLLGARSAGHAVAIAIQERLIGPFPSSRG
jgi:DNA-binding CsgD family transcriptional regulator